MLGWEAAILSHCCSGTRATVAPTHWQEVLSTSTRHLQPDASHSLWTALREADHEHHSGGSGRHSSMPNSWYSRALVPHACLPQEQYMQCNGPPICMCFLGRGANVRPWLPRGCVCDCHQWLVHSRRCPTSTVEPIEHPPGETEADGRGRASWIHSQAQ
jgi:hypothetical protein